MKKLHPVYGLFLILIINVTCIKYDKRVDEPKNAASESQAFAKSSIPKNIVRSIKTDKKGNIWIASWEGIFCHDGKSFFNITSRVSSARFFSILEDRRGNFWFGSIGAGVYYYDGSSFKNYTSKEGLAGNEVTSIYEDKIGNIWFGTTEGVSHYDGRSFRNYTVKEGLPNNVVNWIFEDKSGKIWFGTSGNTSTFDGDKFTTITNNDQPLKNVWSIVEDKNGNIWLGAASGLWRYDGKFFSNMTRTFVGYIYEDKKGNIWTTAMLPAADRWTVSWYNGKPQFGGDVSAIYRFDQQSLSKERPAVTRIRIPHPGPFLGITEDQEGRIWIGTAQGVRVYGGYVDSSRKRKGC
ncbi:ligand-binding sensor domain-containing protein [Desertivirga brevis]|uniref:ligand-binding sensor domain-containing protein n=1 Tax=Desertivirga brevis TaxID=2810310 RepID=UPI001A964D56|nr:two-component regulator propeller domain-containing protein [Pedobacter sp. SYSU D00873]